MVGADLLQLGGDGGVVGRKSAEPPEGASGAGVVALLDQVARGLGEEEHAGDKDDGPGELDGDGDTVAAGVLEALGRVGDDVG